jgi:plasmid replication initiation protein
MYTYLDKTIIKNIKHKYTLPIYELIEDYKNIWQTPYIRLDTLKELTWTDTKYKEFKTYSHHILKPWIKETNQNIQTHHVKPQYKREQRRVVAVKLLIDKNHTASTDNRLKDNNQKIKTTKKLKQANPLISFYKLEYEEQKMLLDDFIAKKIINTIFQSIYEKEGLDSLAIRGLFVRFLNFNFVGNTDKIF